MKFCQCTPELENVHKIIVDGNRCGAGLQLSHWPGNTTPARFKADLSLDIVLRVLASADPAAHFYDADLVTNDHYDTDGFLAIWALLNPTESPEHAPALQAAAAAGDFYEFTSPEAVQFDLVVRAFESPERSPIAAVIRGAPFAQRWQIAVEALMSEMPGLLYEPQRYRGLWQEEYRKLLEKIATVQSGSVEVCEWPAQRLSVVSTNFPLDHFTRNVAAGGHRILEAVRTREGCTYELYYREFLWYDIVFRPRTPKHRLMRVAERLNEMEAPGACGSWGVTKWSPALRFVRSGRHDALKVTDNEPLGYSSLPVETVARVVREELASLDRQALLML
jgi:hypothetical protein